MHGYCMKGNDAYCYYKVSDDAMDAPKWVHTFFEHTIIRVMVGTENNKFAHFLVPVGKLEFEAHPGDYILMGMDGDLHVCNADMFELMFRTISTNKKPELKPCKHCGGTPYVDYSEWGNSYEGKIKCNGCTAVSVSLSRHEDIDIAIEEAIKVWNCSNWR